MRNPMTECPGDPPDDAIEWYDEYGIKCPKCESIYVEDEKVDYSKTTCPEDFPKVDFYCGDCGHRWTVDNVIQMTPAQEERFKKLEKALRDYRRPEKHIMTIDEMFETFDMGDEDFDWSGSEAGDWSVYCCGDKECPVQWHRVAYALDVGRVNGKRFVIARSVDEDGDWDTDYVYDERVGGEHSPEMWYDLARSLAYQMDEYFKGWAEYWLDAAETGKDPCHDATAVHHNSWVDFCLDAVEHNLKYLNMGGD